MKKWLSLAVAACLLLQGAVCAAEETPQDPPAAQEQEAPAPEAGADEPGDVPANPPQSEPVEPPAENPTDNPTENPTDTPADNPTDDPTDTPTDNPTDDPTDTPTENPTDDPTDTPTDNPTDRPTENPTGDPSVDPTGAPTQDPTSAPVEVPEDAEAWMMVEGQLCFGALADMIDQAPENGTIWLHTEKPMFVEKAPLLRMSRINILPDEDVFLKGDWRTAYSAESPLAADEPEELDPETFKDAAADVTVPLYIWVAEKAGEPEPTPTPVPTLDPDEAEISVEASGYAAAEWCAVPPVFTLSGIPEGAPWSYAALIYDERFIPMENDVYAAEEEGIYTLRFVIMDENGDILSSSEKYTIFHDHTPPEVSAAADPALSFTLTVSASDEVSGLKDVSVDGGENWTALDDSGMFTYTAQQAVTLEPGQVQVRDEAGNVWVSVQAYALAAVSNGGGSFGGGGGGGGGDGKKPQPHAASEGKEGEYDALEMQLPEEPMHTLTVDGEELPLTLDLASADDFDIPSDYQARFTAELGVWAAEDPDGEPLEDAEEPKPDTLILTAEEEHDLGDRFEYRWKFNGEVYRMLSNSGIRYVALRVGGDMAAFPTEGFVGGTRYTELKMNGVSTKKFDFTVSMAFNMDPDHIPMLSQWDASEDCDLAIQTEVEGEKYTLSAEQKGEMFFYGVCLGSPDMMDAPYGEPANPNG